jgi:hypothetical protein
MNLAQLWLTVKNLMGPVLGSAQNQVNSWGGKVAQQFNKVAGRTFGVAQAFTFVKGSMEESLNRAKQFVNMGKRMGMPADKVAQLERYSEMAGVNLASLGRGMTSLQKFAGQAMSDMNSKQGSYARQLGLTREQLNRMRAGQVEAFIEVRKAMDAIPSKGEQTRLWIAILGERFTELREFVEKSAQEMEDAQEGQIAMSHQTIEAVAETQKAWGNMWAELSVLIAQFIRDNEPLIGMLRISLNLVMMLVRTFAFLFGQVMSLAQAAFLVVKAFVQLRQAIKTGDYSGLKDTSKQFEKVVDEANEKRTEWLQGLKRDVGGISAGGYQMIGRRTSVDMPNARPVEPILQDRRTYEDVFEYEKAMRTQEAIERKREDSLLVDQAKIDNLKEIVKIEEYEEKLLEERFGYLYKETKEYLEYFNKKKEKLREIEKLEYDLAQKRYDNAVSWIDLANEYYLKEMELTYRSEADIREEKARQAVDKIGLMQKELQKMQQATDVYSEADITKAQQEIFKLAADTAQMLRKPIENIDYKANSLQTVGGGGNISFSALSIAKAQLMQQQESNRWLQILARQTEMSGSYDAIRAANTYARTVGGGLRP